MSKRIKTALAGFGKAGEFLHAPFIHTDKSFELAVILERTPLKAAQAYPQAKIVRTFEEICADQSIELIVCATPNDTHAGFAEQALLAGKHVVVDKPFTVHLEDAIRLQELSLKVKKHIFVYQNRRWDGDFLTVKKILTEGVLGDVLTIESRFDRYRPQPRINYWKESDAPGNGLWYDLGPHLMDQAFQLLGKPKKCEATIKKQREGSIGIDYFDVEFAYNKIAYRIHAGMLEKERTPRWRIIGNKGTYTKYGVDPQEVKLNSGQQPEGTDWGKEDILDFGKINFLDGRSVVYPTLPGNYRTFYAGVFETIRNDAPLLISMSDAVELVAWLEKLATD